ncbi:hypothetical protein ACFQX6_36770 [Streptosporangium lutulentum]
MAQGPIFLTEPVTPEGATHWPGPSRTAAEPGPRTWSGRREPDLRCRLGGARRVQWTRAPAWAAADLEPPVASPKGAVLLRYGLGAGIPGTGEIRREDRGVGPS